MDAGKGKSSDFMLSQALANQVTGIPFDQCWRIGTEQVAKANNFRVMTSFWRRSLSYRSLDRSF